MKKKIDWPKVWGEFNKRFRKYENSCRYYISWRTQQTWIKEIINEQLK